MKVFLFVSVFVMFAMLVYGVEDIQKCSSAKMPANEDVDITKCTKPPCHLKRKSTYAVNYKIKPERDVKTLVNTVFARVAGLPLPFVGVDNTNACDQVYNSKDEKVGCPLKAGEEYVYKNEINVLPIYPKLSLVVHWALTADKKEDIFCFEVPAKITN